MNKEKSALKALQFIIPLLKKYNFKWVITGGFASYAYGVKRPITDIDIDLQTTVKSSKFKNFIKELKPYISQPLKHWTDKNYDNYNFEIIVSGQVIDICPMKELKIFVKNRKAYQNFYSTKFPKHELIKFHDLTLPLLSKEIIIKNKEMLVWQRESDHKDILGLKHIMAAERPTDRKSEIGGRPGSPRREREKRE